MQPKVINTLQSLGLTNNESNIYLASLKNPDQSAAELGRILRLDKSSAYRACDSLEKLGLLISNPQIRGTTYKAASPDILMNIYQAKKEEISSLENTINSSIFDLKELMKEKPRDTFVRTEYGVKALQKAMTESLLAKEKVIFEIIIGDIKKYASNQEHLKFVLNFAKQRVEKGIKIKQIERYEEYNELVEYSKIMNEKERYLKEVRVAPKTWNDKNSIRIWDDTINIISYDDLNDFLVIVIKDAAIATFMKNIFGFIWANSSEKVA